MDWGAINEVVCWATMRFPPQAEVHRDEIRVSYTSWLPPAYRDEAYGTEKLPEGLDDDRDDERRAYYHDTAVTYQITTSSSAR